ncbi:MAG TPA: TSUP family transporter [Nocardioidaceae bacterium]|nr:TSUP family transporter [Nocardioidaceae bacterium]
MTFEILVVIVALGIGAFVKGLTGSGLPQVAIPAMALFLGVERAVIIMSVAGVASNVWLLVLHARSWRHSRDLPALVGAGVAGAVVGTLALTAAPSRWLSLGLALLILGYVAVRIRRPQTVLPPSTSVWTAPPVGLLAGGMQGATGMSGPLLTTYLYSYGLSPPVYIFSLATLFLVFALAQVVTLVALGAYTTTLLFEALLALLPVAVMLPVGSWASRRVGERNFSRVIMASLVVAAVVLMVRALG